MRRFRTRGRGPNPMGVCEYFSLFTDLNHLCGVHELQARLMGAWEKSREWMKGTRAYEGFEEFLRDC